MFFALISQSNNKKNKQTDFVEKSLAKTLATYRFY